MGETLSVCVSLSHSHWPPHTPERNARLGIARFPFVVGAVLAAAGLLSASSSPQFWGFLLKAFSRFPRLSPCSSL